MLTVVSNKELKILGLHCRAKKGNMVCVFNTTWSLFRESTTEITLISVVIS